MEIYTDTHATSATAKTAATVVAATISESRGALAKMPLCCILVWVPGNLSQDNPFAAVDQLYLYIALATKKFELCPLYSTNFHRFHCHFDLLLKVLAIYKPMISSHG